LFCLVIFTSYEKKRAAWESSNPGKKVEKSLYFKLYADAEVEYSMTQLAKAPRRQRRASAKFQPI